MTLEKILITHVCINMEAYLLAVYGVGFSHLSAFRWWLDLFQNFFLRCLIWIAKESICGVFFITLKKKGSSDGNEDEIYTVFGNGAAAIQNASIDLRGFELGILTWKLKTVLQRWIWIFLVG